MTRFIGILALAAALASAPPARADHDETPRPHAEKLGEVRFAVSCKPELQAAFSRGVALLHSFAYVEAGKAFAEIAAKDPSCGMAHWGLAMSNYHPIWAPPSESEFAAGRAAAQKAAELGAPTPRERDYIAAINAFYKDDGVPHPTRAAAFEQAMAGVASRHAADDEASIFHALAILGVAYHSPPDKSYARQKRAAEILNGMLKRHPDHPGIAHYVIHSFDYPDLAELALPAARAYAKIAPSAPHALHMPSHIFTRLAMWKESIASNMASANAAQARIADTHPGATAFDALHAWDYLTYAYLQSGQDEQAREMMARVSKVEKFDNPQFAAGYAMAAVPARYALERRAWADAAALTPHASFPWEKIPYAEAIIHFARTVGAARSGDLATARTALEKLTAIQKGLQGQKGFDWATQVEVQRLAAAGWVARAEKNDEEAVKLLRAAADLEDRTDKHPVTPGSILPAREMLADLLVELGQHSAALAEYELSLKTAPGRLNSYFGAAVAAEKSGVNGKAMNYQERIVALCGGKPPARATAMATTK